MAPKLYIILPSPPVRAVLMCAKALGVTLETVDVDLLNGEHLKPEFLKLNPRHTVPVLEEEDGFTICDSHAIMSYLVSKYGKDKSLYPTDLRKRAIVDERLHFDSNVLFARGLLISRQIVLGDLAEVPEERKDTVREAFAIAEKFLGKSKWVAGDELTIADFSFATTITAWSVFAGAIEKTNYPNIYNWLKEMEKLPYYNEATKEGHEIYVGLIHKRLAENAKKV